MRIIDAEELKTAFPCGELVRTESVLSTIDHMPTINMRNRGMWVQWAETGWHGFHCSECDYETQRATLFCPGCGADMRENELIWIGMGCQSCGSAYMVKERETVNGWNFCPMCGARIND